MANLPETHASQLGIDKHGRTPSPAHADTLLGLAEGAAGVGMGLILLCVVVYPLFPMLALVGLVVAVVVLPLFFMGLFAAMLIAIPFALFRLVRAGARRAGKRRQRRGVAPAQSAA
jgi:hypothetical protein